AAETAQRPIVIVLEDLDDGDKPSLEVIEAARKNLADSPLLVLATGRPALKGLAAFFGERNVTQVELGPLSADAAEKIVREARAGGAASGAAVTLEVLMRRSRGNAFHLQELVRTAGTGQASENESAQEAARATIMGLLPYQRHIVGAASVLGNVFW